MWIVRLALRRPYTFVVLSLLILILGITVIQRTPTDIFPNVNIPVVTVVWGYNGLSPEQMADRIDSVFERSVTTTVDNVEHMETLAVTGTSVTKIYFHPGSNVQGSVAQVTAIAQTMLRQLPPGTLPPLIIAYNASSVPVLDLALSGKGFSQQRLFDLATNFLRPQLATVQGASSPYPFCGKQPQVQVDIDGAKLQAMHLSPADVV
jgi:multidrug efflux pump subunit AcrB